MNGIRRLSESICFLAHMLFVLDGERTNCGRGCSFSVFCCQQTNIDCSTKGVKGNTDRPNFCGQTPCLISPDTGRDYAALRFAHPRTPPLSSTHD